MELRHNEPIASPPAGAVANGSEFGPQLSLFGIAQTELTSNDYYTPSWIFAELKLTFDIDVASPPNGPPFTPCRKYFTQLDDGLIQPWTGSVFMNPPFSNPGMWVAKWLDHANGIALLPFSKSAWFDKLWDSQAAIVRLPWNLKFNDPKGGGGSIFLACLLAGLGEANINALHNIGKVR